MEFLVQATRVNGTPVFIIAQADVRLSKVFGATLIHRKWYFPAFYPVHRIVLSDFQALGVTAQFSEVAQRHIDQMDGVEARIKERRLPENFQFKTPPYEHQLDGLIHCLYFYRAALFYGCGLGKTKCIIDWQRALGCTPLVLCPKVVLRVWAVEAQKHGVEQEFRIVDAASKKGKLKQLAELEDEDHGYAGFAVSYDVARLYHEEIAHIAYDAVVADECHALKSVKSARTKAATELAGKASRRVIMSGTPSLGNPLDMYSQFRFLAPCFMSENYWHFRNKFCVTSPYNKHIVTGFKNLDVLHKRTSLVALSRTKEECLDLPERTIIDERIPLGPKQQRAYNTLVLSKEYQELFETLVVEEGIFGEAGKIDIANAAILVNKLLQVASGFIYKKEASTLCDGCEHLRSCVVQGIQPNTPACLIDTTPIPRLVERFKENAKLAALVAKLDEILVNPENKIIIWAQYHTELDLLDEALNTYWADTRGDSQKKYHHVRADGRTKNINDVAEIFDTDPACRVYLGQVSTGVGITLNAASYMLYFSLPWRMDAYEQSLDRNYRVGQKKKTFVYRFLAQGTVDESVAHALSAKGNVAEVLSAVLLCTRCQVNHSCPPGTVPFDAACRFSRTMNRPITQIKQV